MSTYNFVKTVNIDQLQNEITTSSIVTALDHITSSGANLSIIFKASLSVGDESTLNTIVSNHVPSSHVYYSNEVKVIEQPPFAVPSFRTKRNATPSIVQVTPDTVENIVYTLSEERYVNGGMIIIENAEFGDYVEASVEDPSGLIPVPYRAALCENHPIVAQYIDKHWIPVREPGSIQAGSVTSIEINTFPLSAKISAGLALVVKYHAVNSGLTRRVVVNYHLTKKL